LFGATGGSGRLIVTANLSFGEWSAVFGDAKMGFVSDIVSDRLLQVESSHMRSLTL
jgi:hypothetical protein